MLDARARPMYSPAMQKHQAETPSDAPTPGDETASSRPPWLGEMIDTIRLALPMAASQLGQVAMMTTDLALIGRLGGEALAAASLAHTILFASFVIGMGLVAAVAPLAAQAHGARQPRMIRRALRVGIWASVIAGLPLTLLQLRGAEILVALGQNPAIATLAGDYLLGLAWCLIPAWIFIALRNFMSALHRPEPALWITLAAIPVNAVLAYALINGSLGFPQLGIMGAGLATSLVNVGMCVAALHASITMRPFAKYHVLGGIFRTDWSLLGRLVVLGLPISGAFALEYGLFAMAALLMGRLGTAEIAAHQIAFQVASIIFMVPLGISMAATVRVGHAHGRQDTAGMRRAGFAAITLAAAFEIAMTLAVALGRHLVPALFLDASDPANAAALNLAAMLLVVGMTFFVADGIQTVAAGALRGLNDTRVPLVFAAVSFWLVGFTAAYVLGFRTSLGALGIWCGLTLGLVTFMVLLVVRFERLTRPAHT
jgi:MATE family multidrug resistance protein